jgi:hypothetical protein
LTSSSVLWRRARAELLAWSDGKETPIPRPHLA